MAILLLLRTIAYGAVAFTSFLAWILAAAFIGRTSNDFGVYYESAVVVLVAGLLTNCLLPPLHWFFHRRQSASIIASLLVETILVFLLWVLFLGGAAALSDRLPGLQYCSGSLCSLGRAVQAFAWLSWILLTFLFALLVVVGILQTMRSSSGVWMEPWSAELPGRTRASGATEKGVGNTAVPQPAGASMATAPANQPAVEMQRV
ncbi:uncharacterized protein JCM10292_003168 [Rhodotorula paludigena]|uniref:uncharacterized protein n=1 Tax=Rhodotorula paludigena TaxID=86838 RepID=UPI00317825F8